MSLEEKIEKAKALAEKNGLRFWKRCENNSGDELFLAKPKCNYKFYGYPRVIVFEGDTPSLLDYFIGGKLFLH